MRLPLPLLNAVKNRRLIPFIGAGFSKVFNLPSWSELIKQMSTKVGIDPDIANIYGDFLQIAEYISIEEEGLSGMRSELDKKFNSLGIDISKSEAHLILPNLHAPAIYTTNWDNLIERAFDHKKEPYNKIVTLNDFVKSDPQRPHIIKFHGDFEYGDESLVFTETSYFERLSFESPLDIRLRSDMLRHTLLFLGYSLSDFNLRYMWFKLQKLAADQKSKKKRDSFAYIVLAHKNPIFESICKHSRDIEIVHLESPDIQSSMIDLLKQLEIEANK